MAAEPFRLNGVLIDVSDPEIYMRQAHAVVNAVQMICDVDENQRTAPLPIIATALDGVGTLIELAAFALNRSEEREEARRAYTPEPPAYL